MTPRRRRRESVRIAFEAVATSALRPASLVWRFHSPTLRGRYGEESEEGQDREEGQEDKSQEEDQVVFLDPGGHRSARAIFSGQNGGPSGPPFCCARGGLCWRSARSRPKPAADF